MSVSGIPPTHCTPVYATYRTEAFLSFRGSPHPYPINNIILYITRKLASALSGDSCCDPLVTGAHEVLDRCGFSDRRRRRRSITQTCITICTQPGFRTFFLFGLCPNIMKLLLSFTSCFQTFRNPWVVYCCTLSILWPFKLTGFIHCGMKCTKERFKIFRSISIKFWLYSKELTKLSTFALQ